MLAAGVLNGNLEIYNFEKFISDVVFEFGVDETHNELDPFRVLKIEGPYCCLDTGHKVESVKWNPKNCNEVFCSFSSKGAILAYDLQVYNGTPTSTFHSSMSEAGAGGGMLDFLFLSERNAILGGARDGALRMWDHRTGLKPKKIIQGPPNSGSVNSLQASSDGQVVYSATENGFINVWDVRCSCTVLSRISMKEIVGDLLDTKSNAFGNNSTPISIHSIRLSPINPNILGFQLGNFSVMGAIYLPDKKLVDSKYYSDSLFYPYERPDDIFFKNETQLDQIARSRVSFTQDGYLCGGSCYSLLHMVDYSGFGFSSHKRYCETTTPTKQTHSSPDKSHYIESEVQGGVFVCSLKVPSVVSSVTTHPRCNYIVVGMTDNTIAVCGTL
eukprot:TRINITY_DN1082_c0_g1_i10.p1 TRINITY_DN1082_c0_g1~~TRINITY_DN1082_c0_g1_i10.p1  ORF type:complete len:385 (-),score=55.31 TRINITY_DN1082_c0_g1_i10:474-1628(-)